MPSGYLAASFRSYCRIEGRVVVRKAYSDVKLFSLKKLPLKGLENILLPLGEEIDNSYDYLFSSKFYYFSFYICLLIISKYYIFSKTVD